MKISFCRWSSTVLCVSFNDWTDQEKEKGRQRDAAQVLEQILRVFSDIGGDCLGEC